MNEGHDGTNTSAYQFCDAKKAHKCYILLTYILIKYLNIRKIRKYSFAQNLNGIGT